MVAREAAVAALFARISGAYAFSVATRRNFSPETIATPGEPALVLVVRHEVNRRPSPSVPPVRKMTVMAAIYIDVSNNDNAIPDSVLNPILDAIDAALAPDNPATGLCTLGGLVYSAVVPDRDAIMRAPGDKTGKGVAIVPIEITLP